MNFRFIENLSQLVLFAEKDSNKRLFENACDFVRVKNQKCNQFYLPCVNRCSRQKGRWDEEGTTEDDDEQDALKHEGLDD